VSPDSDGDRRNERGSLAVELVLLTPVLVLFVVIVVALGRFELGREEVAAAAAAGAAAAAVAPSAGQAAAAATAAASPALSAVHSCLDPSVAVAGAPFRAGADLRVTVTCYVDDSDLGIPGLAGRTTVVAVQQVPLDPYRVVSP